MPVSNFDSESFVVMITQKGIIKKTSLNAYQNPRQTGIKAINVDEGDKLVGAKICNNEHHVFISTQMGMSLKFSSTKLRDQGRTTRGCTGIKLKKENDQVMGLETLTENNEVLTITEMGYGKRTSLENYRLGSRANVGVVNLKVSEKNGLVVNSLVINADDEFLLITSSGKVIRILSSQIRKTGRVAKGVRIIRLNENEKVVSIAKISPIQNISNDNEK